MDGDQGLDARGVEVLTNPRQDQRLDRRTRVGEHVVGQRIERLEVVLERDPTEAAEQLLADLGRQRFEHVLRRQQTQLDEDLAHARRLVLDQPLRHALDHTDVLVLGERAAPQQHAAQRLAQRPALGEDRDSVAQQDARANAAAADRQHARSTARAHRDEQFGKAG